MPDQPAKAARTTKSRDNQVAHWRRIKAQAEAKLRELGCTSEVSRAEPTGDGTSPQK